MNNIMSSIKGYSYARRQGGGYAGHPVGGGLNYNLFATQLCM